MPIRSKVTRSVDSSGDEILTFSDADGKQIQGATLVDADGVEISESNPLAVAGEISNLPTEYPLPDAQVGVLTPQTDALTDAELRATPVPVSTTSLPLPTDAATETTLAAVLAKLIAAPSTEAKQDDIITALASLLTELAQKTEPSNTQPVSAAALPLPSGAATESTLSAIQLAARFQGIFPNHVDAPDSSTTYVGKEDKDGAYMIQKISVSGTVTTLTYATNLNNASVLTYSAAWAARATTLTYGTFAQAF